jgi:hypothetical protein
MIGSVGETCGGLPTSSVSDAIDRTALSESPVSLRIELTGSFEARFVAKLLFGGASVFIFARCCGSILRNVAKSSVGVLSFGGGLSDAIASVSSDGKGETASVFFFFRL